MKFSSRLKSLIKKSKKTITLNANQLIMTAKQTIGKNKMKMYKQWHYLLRRHILILNRLRSSWKKTRIKFLEDIVLIYVVDLLCALVLFFLYTVSK